MSGPFYKARVSLVERFQTCFLWRSRWQCPSDPSLSWLTTEEIGGLTNKKMVVYSLFIIAKLLYN